MSNYTAPYGVQLKIISASGETVALISDTDLSGSLLKIKVIEKEIGGVEKFSFELPKDYDIVISSGSECYFYIEGILWFIGYIINLPKKDQTDLILKIKGIGFCKKLSETIIDVTYTAQTLAYIINDIGTNYLGLSVGVYYDVAKIDVPVVNDITIEFKDKNLFDIFTELLKIANYDYDNAKYRWYVDNEKELVFVEIITTLQETYFEGYDYQSPKVTEGTSEIINKILAYRTRSTDPSAIEYVATYQDTESQGKLGIFEKKMVFPDYADTTTIQNIGNSILKQFAYLHKKISIKNLLINSPLPFGFYGLANKRDSYWSLLAECDTIIGWDTGNLSVTTFSVSTDRVLTGLRSLKFITASGSLGDYIEYTLDEILYFPIDLRFYIYFVSTAISIKLIFIDKDDAQVEIEAKQIVNEWVKIEASIDEITELGLMKVSDGFLKVSDGFMKVRHLALAGINSIKKIRIYINSNTVITFYIDRIEAFSNMYKHTELLLKESKYSLSSLGFFVDAVFGEEFDSIITEIDKRANDGELALDIVTKDFVPPPPGDHDHDDDYLGILAKAADSDKLDGLHAVAFLPIAGKAADSDKLDGSHLADIQYHQLTNGIVAIIATTDWNNYKATGFYMGLSLANESPGGSWRYCLVIQHNSIWVQQTMWDFSGTSMYQRNLVNNVWQGWKTFWHSGNDGSGSELDADKLDGKHASELGGDPPVGTVYIQFNGKSAPGTLFSGTWTDQSATWAGRFFRATGGAAAAFGTAQADAMQQITGDFQQAYMSNTSWSAITNGAFSKSDGSVGGEDTIPTGTGPKWSFNSANSPGARTAAETRPTNYAIKIWERTA